MSGEGSDLGIAGVAGFEEIGRGGFGVVYRATETDLDRTVAVKVLSGQLDQRARDRFDRERRAMGALSGHPNIVTIYRSGFTGDGQPYLVMEYLTNGSVADQLHDGETFSWQQAIGYGVELCGAIETAHRAGVLHRDIKPGNILLSNLGTPKLGDFGIARLHGAPETRSAVITASVAHAAPEVVSGRRPDERSDIYSLASTLYELIAGGPAFSRPTDESLVPLLARIAQDPVPDLRPRGVPDAICAVLESAMAKDLDARPQTAADLGRALADAQAAVGVAVTAMQIEGEPRTAPTTHTTELRAQPVLPLTGHPPPPVQPPATSAPTATGTAQPRPTPQTAGPTPAHASAPTPAPAPTRVSAPHSTTGPHGTPPRGGIAAPAIAAAAIGVVALVGAIGFAVTRDRDKGSEPPPVTSTTTTTTTTTATTTTVSPPVGGLPTDTGEDYAAYTELTDSTGAITLDVPTEWTDVQVAAGSVTAAPLISDAFGSFRGPGVNVAAVANLGALLTPAGTLDTLEELSCSGPERGTYDDGVYVGLYDRYRDCGSTGADVIHVAAEPEDGSFLVTVSIQFLTPRDETAALEILQTFLVDGASL